MTIGDARQYLDEVGQRLGYDTEIAFSRGDGETYEEASMSTQFVSLIQYSSPKLWRVAKEGSGSVEIVTIW